MVNKSEYTGGIKNDFTFNKHNSKTEGGVIQFDDLNHESSCSWFSILMAIRLYERNNYARFSRSNHELENLLVKEIKPIAQQAVKWRHTYKQLGPCIIETALQTMEERSLIKDVVITMLKKPLLSSGKILNGKERYLIFIDEVVRHRNNDYVIVNLSGHFILLAEVGIGNIAYIDDTGLVAVVPNVQSLLNEKNGILQAKLNTLYDTELEMYQVMKSTGINQSSIESSTLNPISIYDKPDSVSQLDSADAAAPMSYEEQLALAISLSQSDSADAAPPTDTSKDAKIAQELAEQSRRDAKMAQRDAKIAQKLAEKYAVDRKQSREDAARARKMAADDADAAAPPPYPAQPSTSKDAEIALQMLRREEQEIADAKFAREIQRREREIGKGW